MKDRDKIELTLKVLESGAINNKEAVDSILEFYSQSRRFNFNSFQWGVSFGLMIVLILIYFGVL